jgi:hypothetical protein
MRQRYRNSRQHKWKSSDTSWKKFLIPVLEKNLLTIVLFLMGTHLWKNLRLKNANRSITLSGQVEFNKKSKFIFYILRATTLQQIKLSIGPSPQLTILGSPCSLQRISFPRQTSRCSWSLCGTCRDIPPIEHPTS